ncbi:MAG: hypothetical protein KBE24_09650 [Fusobacteriaceae bacterium]|nr:hypothetical protein [Fusobacteriaceae bacterium]
MSDMNSLIKGIGNKNRSLASKDEEILNKEEVLANYNFNYDDVDDETIDYLKDVTYKIHSTTHKFYTNLGKMLLETQEKLANNKTGVFRKWFESIGLNKTFVYDNIARYNYIVRQTDNIKIEKVESLPVTLTYEIAKDSCPELIRERVIGGEIRTKAELKKALKEVKQEKTEEATTIIQEAEIIEDYDVLMKKEFEEIMEVLSNAEVKANRSKNNLDALIKIKKILNGME